MKMLNRYPLLFIILLGFVGLLYTLINPSSMPKGSYALSDDEMLIFTSSRKNIPFSGGCGTRVILKTKESTQTLLDLAFVTDIEFVVEGNMIDIQIPWKESIYSYELEGAAILTPIVREYNSQASGYSVHINSELYPDKVYEVIDCSDPSPTVFGKEG